MGSVTLLDEARAANLQVQADGEVLRIRGPRSSEAVAQRLIQHKAEVLAWLSANDPSVLWRVAAMRSRLPKHGPIPFLVAREAPVRAGHCLSCGETLRGALGRCGPCARAAWLVVLDYTYQDVRAQGRGSNQVNPE
jgi:hypothetical protein